MVNIDVRKLISFGKGSFIVSMPKGWIEKNNLKKGDLISVNDDGSELVLSASQEDKKPAATEIDIEAGDKSLELLKTEIVSSYLNGYDTINILFSKDSHEAPRIKDVIRNLSGLEIMEQTSTRISAKNLININEISLNNIIRRIDIITRAMIEDAILCLTGQCSYDSIHNRDVDINRLYYLGYRVIKNGMKNPRIAKSLGFAPWQMHSDTLMIAKLERIADCHKRIARYLQSISFDRAAISDLSRIHGDISEAYKNVMKAYYNKDKKLASSIEVTNKDRTKLCDKFLESYMQSHAGIKNKNFYSSLVMAAKITENLKTTSVEIRNIARTVLCYE